MLDKSQRGTFKNIKNLQFIGAMNHPLGGRNDIPNRAKRNFMIFNMILPLSVESIYAPIIKFSFKPKYFSNEFNNIIEILPYATAQLWTKVKNTILPTPSKFHYQFNMRELSRIFKGFLQIKKEVITASHKLDGMK
jgi:dynein heavy chain